MRELKNAQVRALVLAIAAVGAGIPSGLGAQGALAPTAEWRGAPVFTSWSFGTAIEQSAGDVSSVQQFAVPLRARFRIRDRWSVDVASAVSSSTVSLKSGSTTRSLSLSGLSDLNVRLTGPLIGDAFLLTAGVNIPTGSTELGADATAVVQAIAAPALSMPVSALGLGFGGTLGILGAREMGPWAVALGASVEQRTEYTPIALALSSGQSRTTLAPGMATHLSLGADRSIGAKRLALVVVGDLYAEDGLTLAAGGVSSTSNYSLGPQVSAIGRLDFAAGGWRDAALNAAVRMRSQFTDAAGSKVAGSGGSYLEGSIGGVRGGPADRGLILGADARWHSGLEFTSALVGASVAAAGATVGVDWPFAQAAIRVALRGQYGTLNTGSHSSSIMGLQLSGSIAARGGAR
jgi:hypothetical protein